MKPLVEFEESQKAGKKHGLIIKRLNVTKLSAFKKIIRSLLISSLWDGNVFRERTRSSLNLRVMNHMISDSVDLKHLTLDLRRDELFIDKKPERVPIKMKKKRRSRKNGKK